MCSLDTLKSKRITQKIIVETATVSSLISIVIKSDYIYNRFMMMSVFDKCLLYNETDDDCTYCLQRSAGKCMVLPRKRNPDSSRGISGCRRWLLGRQATCV